MRTDILMLINKAGGMAKGRTAIMGIGTMITTITVQKQSAIMLLVGTPQGKINITKSGGNKSKRKKNGKKDAAKKGGSNNYMKNKYMSNNAMKNK